MSALTLTRSQCDELRRMRSEFYAESVHAHVSHNFNEGCCIAATPVQADASRPKFYCVSFSWLSREADPEDYDTFTGEFYALKRMSQGFTSLMSADTLSGLTGWRQG